MIAPLREPDEGAVLTTQGLRRARRLVAATLLKTSYVDAGASPPLTGWRAVVLTAWMAIAGIVYLKGLLW